MSQIDLRNISVNFNQKKQTSKAVENVSLKINKGDIYGIVGYSGAGKSTLVRVINRLQEPTSGSVFIEQQNITNFNHSQLRKLRHNIGFIFQRFNLMNARTIEENILYPMIGTNISSNERKLRVNNLIKLVGLIGKENFYPAQLSGGQKQRVAIARALANNPRILISDEATSALDPKTTNSILRLLKRVNKELGITVVLITHEMDVVKALCNKVAVMDSGRIIEEGTILNVFSKPKEQLTKDFIDTTNNIKNTLVTLSNQSYFLELSAKHQLFRLNYIGKTTEEAIIIDLYKQFGALSSIIYGNIEFIQNVPIGNLVITIDSNETNLKEIKEYLYSKNIYLKDINLQKFRVSQI